HLEDYTNPHRVTAEQIGLGNVENVAVDDMRPTYTAKTGALQRWDKDSDPCVKDHNRCEYGLHYRGAAALVAPQLIIGGNLG
ncbi:MAG: hypothetical protein IKO93_15345, partial [Lentisphaeria bacterium]|nr:hypothetical protein [Lentisphaeria bacterium]